MFERKEIYELEGMPEHISEFKEMLKLTIKYTKSTNKIINIVKILNAILNVKLDEKTKGEIWRLIVNLLFHKYPIISKTAADSFYMYTLTHGDDEFGEEISEEIQDILIEQDWLEMTDKDKNSVKESLEKVLGDKLPAEEGVKKKKKETVKKVEE